MCNYIIQIRTRRMKDVHCPHVMTCQQIRVNVRKNSLVLVYRSHPPEPPFCSYCPPHGSRRLPLVPIVHPPFPVVRPLFCATPPRSPSTGHYSLPSDPIPYRLPHHSAPHPSPGMWPSTTHSPTCPLPYLPIKKLHYLKELR